MRIVLAFELTVDPKIAAALTHRGHHVFEVGADAVLARPPSTHLSSADLIVVDAELAERADLVATLASESPGIELILIGPRRAASHPDVIEQLDRPIAIDRLLAVVDELADVLDGERLREPADLVAYETLFAGNSPQIRDLLRRVRIVSRSDAPVWIVGDDGSGRAIIARAIHDRSVRRTQPFVAYNTAAYTDDDLARILFRGDSAAVAQRGGTLFIERIGSAGPTTQRELIHYVEATARNGAGPRLIFGIQRDQAMEPPPFVSKELYYRLKVLEVEIPPLRERARDLEEIVGRMLERLANNGQPPEVSDKTMDLLERYSFPGNFLELAHALTHAFILARGAAIQPEHLPISIRSLVREPAPAAALSQGELEALDVVAKRFERDYLLRVLRSVGGNRGRAADILGLTRKGLWGKLKTHGISDHDIENEDAP